MICPHVSVSLSKYSNLMGHSKNPGLAKVKGQLTIILKNITQEHVLCHCNTLLQLDRGVTRKHIISNVSAKLLVN